MGAGSSQEAAFELKASVPAGTYHFQLDCIIVRPVDVTFDLLWRRGSTDMTLASWMQHFEPLPIGFGAQPNELDQDAPAIDFQDGDQIVFRYAGANTISSQAYFPNGDHVTGNIPNFTLP